MTGLAMLGLKRTQETLKVCKHLNPRHEYSHGYSPLGVTILLDVILALSQCVPELDRSVTRTGNDLPVISAEADGKNVRGVANEATSGVASVEVPEAEGVIPGRRQSELAVRRDNDIRNEVVVAMKDALGVAVGVLVAGQLPDNDSLVYGGED